MLGSLILYLKGMRRMMFQLSGFYSMVRINQRLKRLSGFTGLRFWEPMSRISNWVKFRVLF